MVLEHEHDPERVPLYRFLGPRYWLLWLGLGLVRALNMLPLRCAAGDRPRRSDGSPMRSAGATAASPTSTSRCACRA